MSGETPEAGQVWTNVADPMITTTVRMKEADRVVFDDSIGLNVTDTTTWAAEWEDPVDPWLIPIPNQAWFSVDATGFIHPETGTIDMDDPSHYARRAAAVALCDLTPDYGNVFVPGP